MTDQARDGDPHYGGDKPPSPGGPAGEPPPGVPGGQPPGNGVPPGTSAAGGRVGSGPSLDVLQARIAGLEDQRLRRPSRRGQYAQDAETDAAGRLWFAPAQRARLARVQRLRAGFALNYAAVALVADLLDRIAAHEAAARGNSLRDGGPPWTRTN